MRWNLFKKTLKKEALPSWIEYTPKLPMSMIPDTVLIKPCRLCGGSPSVDYFKPQGHMVYCSGCHFVMIGRESTIEKAV